MRRLVLLSALLCTGLVALPMAQHVSAAQGAAPRSGIAIGDLDRSVRPQDDFYRYAVGGWIRRVKGPAYMPGWSAGRELQLNVYEALDKDVRELMKGGRATGNERKLADIYASYIHVEQIDRLGLTPIAPYLATFDAAKSPTDIADAIAMLSAQGLDLGIGTWVHPDDEDPSRYLADFVQSDLGLSERDYYLSDEPRFATIRDAYRGHVARVLSLSGVADADTLARKVIALETRLAKAQWTQVATRVPGATAHRVSRKALADAVPGLDMARFAQGIGIPATAEHFNISQPDYFATYGKLLAEVPAPVWRAYLRVRLIDHLARFLPQPYRDEADRFFSGTLYGATASRPRWLRAMGVLEDSMGDALGQLYVQKHVPPEAQARARVVLDNVIASFRQRIAASDWLSDTSKQGALAKLDQLVIRMGAPGHIRDYGRLVTAPDDAVGNWMRARTLLARFEIEKLSRPVDREEWTMSPQSVNGYYSVSRNQVVLPAALLQAPYFQADADDAVNYGGLGFFIAHELSHAFDRAGSQYDGEGKRVEWMTPADRAEFERRAHAIVVQFDDYAVSPGHHLNGELTIGENIADTSGLAIAYDAYQRSLQGHPAPVIDGFTGDQRFYLGFARTWASEPIVTQAAITHALADTHAPDRFRVTGAVSNQDAFHRAYRVKEGDGEFRAPDKRARIW